MSRTLTARLRVFGAFAAVLVSLACTTTTNRIQYGRAALSRADPQHVAWRYLHTVDVNCDDTADDIFTASDEQWFYVAAVLGPVRVNSHYSVVAFALSGDYQESLCGPVSGIMKEALASAMADATGEEELGYRIVKDCSGLRLQSGECDPFHIYWNRMSNALDWWRL